MPLIFLLLVEPHFKGHYCSSTEATGRWSRQELSGEGGGEWGCRGKVGKGKGGEKA